MKESKNKRKTRTRDEKPGVKRNSLRMHGNDPPMHGGETASLIDLADRLCVGSCKLELVSQAIDPVDELQGAAFVVDEVRVEMKRIEKQLMSLFQTAA